MDDRHDEFPGVGFPPAAEELIRRDGERDLQQERGTGAWRHGAKAPDGGLTLAEGNPTEAES